MLLRIYPRVVLSVIFFTLVSCATTPVSNDSATEVGKQNVINAAMTARQSGYGQVVVKRDRGLNTGACRSRIYANGEPVADIAPGEKITMFLPPGEQMLAAKATGVCAGGLVEITANVTDKRTTTFRVSYGTWGEFSIQPTAF